MIFSIQDNKKMDTKSSGIKKDDGFTLLEVIMAVSVLTIGLLAVASMQVSAIRGNSISREYTESTDSVQNVVEKLLSLNISASQLAAGNHTEGELNLNTTDKYTVIWSVQDNTPINDVKTISVTVQWKIGAALKQHSFALLRTRV
jgi:type IV pilus assembly protein PilV